MENSLGFAHFLAQGDGVSHFVLGLLFLASSGTWYLIAVKGVQVWRATRLSRKFVQEFWEAPNLEAVARTIHDQGANEPFSHLLHHGFTAMEQIDRCKTTGECPVHSLVNAGSPDEILSRALKRAIEEDKSRMEYGQTFLATVASAAPFVGLFGTVWGIYHALVAIGLSGQGTLDKVAGPVGEALIMTGIGLAVAIPAAIAYNAFARTNRNTLAQLNSFAHDVFNFFATGIKASPMHTDARTSSDKVIALVRQGADCEAAGRSPSLVG